MREDTGRQSLVLLGRPRTPKNPACQCAAAPKRLFLCPRIRGLRHCLSPLVAGVAHGACRRPDRRHYSGRAGFSSWRGGNTGAASCCRGSRASHKRRNSVTRRQGASCVFRGFSRLSHTSTASYLPPETREHPAFGSRLDHLPLPPRHKTSRSHVSESGSSSPLQRGSPHVGGACDRAHTYTRRPASVRQMKSAKTMIRRMTRISMSTGPSLGGL